jgi:hypothetical protein
MGPVVIFSHECDILKSPSVLVADILSDDDTDPGLLGNIRAARVFHGYYLDGCLEPGWVNLRTIRPVLRDPLVAKIDSRLHSMTDRGRIALAMKTFSFMMRSLPPTQAPPPVPPAP